MKRTIKQHIQLFRARIRWYIEAIYFAKKYKKDYENGKRITKMYHEYHEQYLTADRMGQPRDEVEYLRGQSDILRIIYGKESGTN